MYKRGMDANLCTDCKKPVTGQIYMFGAMAPAPEKLGEADGYCYLSGNSVRCRACSMPAPAAPAFTPEELARARAFQLAGRAEQKAAAEARKPEPAKASKPARKRPSLAALIRRNDRRERAGRSASQRAADGDHPWAHDED